MSLKIQSEEIFIYWKIVISVFFRVLKKDSGGFFYPDQFK
jgi:hypothetical protein